MSEESSKVLYVGWKNNIFALVISIFYITSGRVTRVRKRLKEISSNAKTARKFFGDQPMKDLEILVFYGSYNHKMGAVDIADQLAGYNRGFRRLRRGPIQAID
jgi:hypothetical protein